MHNKDHQQTIHHLRLFGVLVIFILVLAGTIQFGKDAITVAPVKSQPLPVISIGQTSYSVNEGNSIDVVVQVNTLPSSTLTVTVDYATSGGTAVAGTDYTDVSGVLTFTSTSLTQMPVTIQTFTNPSLNDRTVNFTISNPTNATTDPARSSATIFIRNTDPTPTPAATGSAQPIFSDALEPNNNFNEASDINAGSAATCNLTFYPPGDQDYFRWWGVAGISYNVTTSNLVPGIDTVLYVYNSNQQLIAQNDNVTPGNFSSKVTFTANSTGYYYAQVINQQPGDPVNKTYCFQVSQFVDPTVTPPPGFPTGADACEWNSTIEAACLIVVDSTLALTFVPTLGSPQDTDMFRLWIKPGIYYTCETEIPAGSAADTNMILFDGNGNPFSPWIGNDDKEPGNLGSKVSYLSTYTGWLFIEVGPVDVLPLSETAQQTYTLTCTQTAATPTPTPTNTAPPPVSPPGGGTFATSTPIPTLEIATPFPTPTEINLADLIPTPEPPPIIDFIPLPTVTPASGGTQVISIQVTVFYDLNWNYLPELNEGIMDMAVALYDNATGELLSFGQTNEAGTIRFETQTTGTVRIVVPYLNYTQIVTQSSDEILIRIAPGTLPIGLP